MFYHIILIFIWTKEATACIKSVGCGSCNEIFVIIVRHGFVSLKSAKTADCSFFALKKRFFKPEKTEIKREKRRKTCVFRCASFLYALRGGGERWRKKVDNGSDFLQNLPRKEVEVPGLAFHVVIIGRNELKRITKMNEAWIVSLIWWRWSECGNGWEQHQCMCIIDCGDIHTHKIPKHTKNARVRFSCVSIRSEAVLS